MILDTIEKPRNVRLLNSRVNMDESAHTKKALKYAIEQSKGEIIITTDTNSKYNNKWLYKMVSYFNESIAFVSGAVQFESNGNLFEEIWKLEFSSLILVGAWLMGIKKPIICNAANLGFRKSVFNAVGGYDDNLNLSSGEDEFLMEIIPSKTNFNIKFSYDKKPLLTQS